MRGFTLIELMIVVAVVGVLAAIAFPSYQTFIQKSRRVDAKNAVLDMAARQERYFSINNAYVSDAAKLGYSALPLAVGSGSNTYYTLSVTLTTTTPAGYVAKAVPITGTSQVRDTTCYTYQIDNLGAQSQADSSGTAFTNASCW